MLVRALQSTARGLAARGSSIGCPGCRTTVLYQSTATKVKTGGKKKKKKGGEEGGEASNNAWHLSVADSPPGPLTKALPVEEQERFKEIGKTYNIMLQKQRCAEEGDLQRKIKLKQEAIDALPLELQDEAWTIDTTPFPTNRRLTTWTPPMPGFEPAKYDVSGAT